MVAVTRDTRGFCQTGSMAPVSCQELPLCMRGPDYHLFAGGGGGLLIRDPIPSSKRGDSVSARAHVATRMLSTASFLSAAFSGVLEVGE